MPKPQDVGRDAENKAVSFFAQHGYKFARRLRLKGAKDEGDISLSERYPVVVEVKGGQKAVSQLHAHVRELREEIANAKAETGFVVAKKPGSAKVEEWLFVMPGDLFIELLKDVYPPEG
jgi:hypothetical protein